MNSARNDTLNQLISLTIENIVGMGSDSSLVDLHFGGTPRNNCDATTDDPSVAFDFLLTFAFALFHIVGSVAADVNGARQEVYDPDRLHASKSLAGPCRQPRRSIVATRRPYTLANCFRWRC